MKFMNCERQILKTFILLFRGINVGGRNMLPMKELVVLLDKLGYSDVLSYINSGNIVLKSKTNPASTIKNSIAEEYGFKPELFVLTEPELEVAIANNPYKHYQGKFVHFYFCKSPIDINMEKTNKYKTSSEVYQIQGNVFYLHAPDGIGRSKLVANIESCLGQVATGRNLNTVTKISAMLETGY